MREDLIQLDELPETCTVVIEEKYRKKLFNMAIEKAGSMHSLSRILGYTGAPWSLKQIIRGIYGIPIFRLKKLSDFLQIPLEQMSQKIVRVKTKGKRV